MSAHSNSLTASNRPRPRRTRSATRIATGWAASWHGLQRGNRLQQDTISEMQIASIALGGVIGTGLFLGSATALRHAGPGGAVVGYIITGSVVYCVNRSLAHIVSCFPRSGGPVGLAHLYVDPALAFALGWFAWYNWTIIYPAEIAAASLLMNTFRRKSFTTDDTGGFIPETSHYAWTGAFIGITLSANLLGARYYGRLEATFSLIKICTIVGIIIACFVLAARAPPDSEGRTGFFRYWLDPGAFASYRSEGALGRFFAIWSVLLQACFSFFGTEVAVMAAAEVRRPEVSIPGAAKNVWIRIFVFYVVGVFGAGLLVPHDHKLLGPASPNINGLNLPVLTSPFVIGFSGEGNQNYKAAWTAAALFALAAFSAALTDIFISSRLLFFLSKCGHAPEWCSKVVSMPFALGRIPLAGVLICGAFGTLAFMTVASAEEAFSWLSTMTSTAALSSWIGMLVTYLKWMRAIDTAVLRATNGEPFFQAFVNRYGERFPTGRFFAQLRAWYALIMCSAILLFNGWAVFTLPGQWIIATTSDSKAPRTNSDIAKPVSRFVTSYLPVPFMLLLIFGYKLINRTQAVTIEEMTTNMALEWDAAALQMEAEAQDRRDQPEQVAPLPWPIRVYRIVRNVFAFVFCWNPERL